jgi:hypothetical protein
MILTLHLASPSVEYSPSNYKGLYCLFHVWLTGFDRDSRDFTSVGCVILLRRKASHECLKPDAGGPAGDRGPSLPCVQGD